MIGRRFTEREFEKKTVFKQYTILKISDKFHQTFTTRTSESALFDGSRNQARYEAVAVWLGVQCLFMLSPYVVFHDGGLASRSLGGGDRIVSTLAAGITWPGRQSPAEAQPV